VLGDIKPIVVAPNGIVPNEVVAGRVIEPEPNDVPANGDAVVDGWTVRVPDVDVWPWWLAEWEWLDEPPVRDVDEGFSVRVLEDE